MFLYFLTTLFTLKDLSRIYQVISKKPMSLPWGTFGIKNANEVFLKHVHFDNGSGYKDSIKEYSAMLSIHNVENFKLQDCKLSNSFIVDDMLHVVYGNGSIINSDFENSFADAIDIDISKVTFDGLKLKTLEMMD